MEFKAKIYIPNTKLNFFQKWALTEQLSFLSFVVAIFILIIENFFSFDTILNDYIIVKIFYCLCIIPAMILSITYRYWEFERINGELKGEISFEETGIQIDEKLYLFSEIQNLHISYGNIVGDSTSSRYGPAYSIGINNYIEFQYKNKKTITYFQIQSRSQYVAIQADLFYYVINEIFPFEKKNLNFIDKKYHHHTLYKEFIEKMKREGKLT